jgi:hypothetical protein
MKIQTNTTTMDGLFPQESPKKKRGFWEAVSRSFFTGVFLVAGFLFLFNCYILQGAFLLALASLTYLAWKYEAVLDSHLMSAPVQTKREVGPTCALCGERLGPWDIKEGRDICYNCEIEDLSIATLQSLSEEGG